MTHTLDRDNRHGWPVIPHSRPSIDEQDAQAAARAIATGTLVGGPYVSAFEEALGERVGARFCCALTSGTEAIHVGLRALGVGPGDEVILPAYVCEAPLFAIRYVGAVPVLADVEPQTGISTGRLIRAVITKRTRAIIAVHLFGRAAPMDEISALGVPVIEDCAQSLGGSLGATPLGSWGTVGIFSFYATKVITTGRGGMICTDDRRIIERVRDLTRYDEREDSAIALNCSMTSFQAAIGSSQLARLDALLDERRKIYDFYVRVFSDAGISLVAPAPPEQDIHYRFIIKAQEGAERIIGRLNGLGITARRPIYRPVYAYTETAELPGTKRAYLEDISIPLYPALTDDERGRVAQAVLEVFGKAS